MNDQRHLSEILHRMQSNYKPERRAAADEFIQKEFSTEILRTLIQKTPNPNLASMYFYVSGRRSDKETLAAWEYLRQRFETDPEKFESDFYDPSALDDTCSHLLYAARKHLITKSKFKVFLTHLKCVQDDAAFIIRTALSTLDINLDTPYHDDNEQLIFLARHYVQKVLPDFAVEPIRRNFSPEELEIVSHVTQLDRECMAILGKPMIPILLYRRWLVNFFLICPPANLDIQMLFPTVTTKENLIPFVGYDTNIIDILYCKITNPVLPDAKIMAKTEITINEIKSAFHKMRNMISYYSSGDNIGEDVSSSYHELVGEILKLDKKTFLTWSIRNLLYDHANTELCIEMLKRIENVLVLQQSNDHESYAAAAVSTSFYFYFEQDDYDAGYSLDFHNLVLYWIKKVPDIHFYENLLLPYLKKDAFFDIGSKRASRAYMALDTLLSAKSIAAYLFTKELLSQGNIDQLVPPSSNYWEFSLCGFYKALLRGNVVKRPVDDIGYDWERICQRIAKIYYEDVLANYEGIYLENDSIPDIAVGAPQFNNKGKITHVSKIIECKKSLYFVEHGTVLNNETTYKYYDYCDTLEYWILDGRDYRFSEEDIVDFPKLKCIFASDLLEASWLSKGFKDEIYWLLEQTSRQNPSCTMETISELCCAIDHLVACPPPDIPDEYNHSKKKPNRKSPHKNKEDIVVRQYNMDGTFLKEYESSSQAASETGLRIDAITNVISGRRNSAGGFLWKKCPKESPVENIVPSNTALDLEGKNIIQIDHNDEIIATFSTIGQAVKSSGISRRSISDALKGIQKTAGGFTWMLGKAEGEI